VGVDLAVIAERESHSDVEQEQEASCLHKVQLLLETQPFDIFFLLPTFASLLCLSNLFITFCDGFAVEN